MGLADDAPRLSDWLTVPAAARRLGVTKQAVHKIIQQDAKVPKKDRTFKTLSRIDDPDFPEPSRTIFVIRQKEVDELAQTREDSRQRQDDLLSEA